MEAHLFFILKNENTSKTPLSTVLYSRRVKFPSNVKQFKSDTARQQRVVILVIRIQVVTMASLNTFDQWTKHLTNSSHHTDYYDVINKKLFIAKVKGHPTKKIHTASKSGLVIVKAIASKNIKGKTTDYSFYYLSLQFAQKYFPWVVQHFSNCGTVRYFLFFTFIHTQH